MNPLKAATIWTLICFGLAAIFAAGYCVCYCDNPPIEPTVEAIQLSLIADGYDPGPVDDNPGPLFRAAYNKRKCQDYADKVLAKMPKE